MFMFLFDPETTSLSSPSLYSSIHHQLGPLQKPLLRSTSPETALSRLPAWEGTFEQSKRSSRSQPIYDLVYDPSNLTIRSSIPNIPALGLLPKSPPLPNSPRSPSSPPSAPSTTSQWSRLESLAIHHRILSTYVDTRSRPHELERTCKTNRGWWILWVRIPHTQPSPQTQPISTTSSSVALSSIEDEDNSSSTSSQPQEAFLVRKASDYAPVTGHARMSSGGRFLRDLGGATYTFGSSRADITSSKFIEGLGLDPRRYVEGLLRLNR